MTRGGLFLQQAGRRDRKRSADLLWRSTSLMALRWLTIMWLQGTRYLVIKKR